jgi:hypothetical protein
MSHFDLAANLARAEAQRLIPDHPLCPGYFAERDSERRHEMMEAAKEVEISDLSDSFLESDDEQSARFLLDWFMDELIEKPATEVLRACLAAGGMLEAVMREAAKQKAEHDWNVRYQR